MSIPHDTIADTQPRIDAVPYTEAGLLKIAKYAVDGWHLWVPAGDDGTKKAPADHDGKRYETGYDATQPFYTYNEIRASYSKNNKNKKTPRGGIGLRVRPPLLAIDLDDVVTWRDGQPMYTDDVKAILKLLPTYAELSPSGTGLHVWVKYDGDHSILPKTNHVPLPHGGKMAIYASHTPNNYLTMTGRAVSVREDGIPLLYVIDATQSDIETLLNTWHTPLLTTWYTPQPATAPTPPTDDTPTPAQPATAAKPATVATYDASNRLKKYIDTTWPAVVENACEALKNADSYHIARHEIGWQLGVQLRALELACDTVRLPHSAIPAPATVDAIVKMLYDAKPPEANAKAERKTIHDGTQRGYDECATWKQFGDAYKDLHTIMGEHGITIEASKATKPGKIQPATAATSKPPTPPTDDTPTATAQPAPKHGINFDDIINPSAKATQFLDDLIEQHGEIPYEALFKTAEYVRSQAQYMPDPIIGSTQDKEHLLMAGLCSLSAPSKLGKSKVALHLAYAVATGGHVFGSSKYKARQGEVAYFDLENLVAMVGQRMTHMFEVDPPMYHHVTPEVWLGITAIAQRQLHDRWRALQYLITKQLRAYPDTRLLILDNVIQFEPQPLKGEAPRAAEERYLRWLAGLCLDYPNMCVLMVDHHTKMQSTDKVKDKDMTTDKQQGSFIKRALLTAGSITMVKIPPTDEVPPDSLRLWTSPRACAPLDIIIKDSETHGHHVLLDVKPLDMSVQQRQIYNAIRNGYITPKAIADELKIKVNVVDTQLGRLVSSGIVYRPSTGIYSPVEPTHRHTPQTTQHTIDESEAF